MADAVRVLDDSELKALFVNCGRCGAEPFEPCKYMAVAPYGAPFWSAHTERDRQAELAGVTLDALQRALVAAKVTLWLERQQRTGGQRDDE